MVSLQNYQIIILYILAQLINSGLCAGRLGQIVNENTCMHLLDRDLEADLEADLEGSHKRYGCVNMLNMISSILAGSDWRENSKTARGSHM